MVRLKNVYIPYYTVGICRISTVKIGFLRRSKNFTGGRKYSTFFRLRILLFSIHPRNEINDIFQFNPNKLEILGLLEPRQVNRSHVRVKLGSTW